ncbi:hypothetical protein HNP84_002621 [Thermocatellispora tengchongensis]|uniref:Tyrosine-protein phosphatase n=1 Tax=Thermocatellispora tengchongensis TaxID=1073253 RepID=A0A840P5Z9_9ACTN|nr:tyrosine-protein phosphatase [Thermocatellispora tengchongensis]MBB5132900.1 hypothetical protein [Thermocatellispora tengchongensis]
MNSLCNFRDVASGSPGRIVPGRLFRSDAPDDLTPSDIEHLTDELRIGCVLDLRHPLDTAPARVALPGVAHVNIPLLDVGIFPSLPADYAGRLCHDRNLPLAVKALAVLLERPTLVHRTAGKDRTGVVIALALRLADVPRSVIVEDYLRTAGNLPRLLARHRARPLAPEFYECSQEPITAFLDALEADYGGARGWASGAGISPETVSAIEAALTA